MDERPCSGASAAEAGRSSAPSGSPSRPAGPSADSGPQGAGLAGASARRMPTPAYAGSGTMTLRNSARSGGRRPAPKELGAVALVQGQDRAPELQLDDDPANRLERRMVGRVQRAIQRSSTMTAGKRVHLAARVTTIPGAGKASLMTCPNHWRKLGRPGVETDIPSRAHPHRPTPPAARAASAQGNRRA